MVKLTFIFHFIDFLNHGIDFCSQRFYHCGVVSCHVNSARRQGRRVFNTVKRIVPNMLECKTGSVSQSVPNTKLHLRHAGSAGVGIFSCMIMLLLQSNRQQLPMKPIDEKLLFCLQGIFHINLFRLQLRASSNVYMLEVRIIEILQHA